MNSLSIVPLLPFRYNDIKKDADMADRLTQLCSGNLKRLIYFIEEAFTDIFQQESFEMFYMEHQRVYWNTIEQARRFNQKVDENALFANVVQSVFETKTGRLVKNNQVAFNILLSLVRRRYHWETR